MSTTRSIQGEERERFLDIPQLTSLNQTMIQQRTRNSRWRDQHRQTWIGHLQPEGQERLPSKRVEGYRDCVPFSFRSFFHITSMVTCQCM